MPSMSVSGAGTAVVNGTYTERGTHNSKPYYNMVGQGDSTTQYAIVWDGSVWAIQDDIGQGSYDSNEDVATPDLVGFWAVNKGSAPAPTVTVAAASGPANLKTDTGVAKASVKTIDGVAIANVKTKNGVA